MIQFLRIYDAESFTEEKVKDMTEAEMLKDKVKKSYLHMCFHDENPVKACKLISI